MRKIILIICSAVMFISCELSPFGNEESSGENLGNKTNIEEKSSLFEQESGEDSNNSNFVFETNDTSYITRNGYTLWCVKQTNESEEFTDINVTVHKKSGNADAGYGVIFLRQQLGEKDFMIAVMINTKGQFIIGKVIDGIFTAISDWKVSSYLNSGYGIENTILISYDKINSEFILCLNGEYETAFKIEEETRFKNSQSGFVAVISGYEKFPSIPVEIFYKNNGDE